MIDSDFESKVPPIEILSIALAQMLGFAEFDSSVSSMKRHGADNTKGGMAKYVMPMYLNDIMGATCYSCIGNAVSFNFPNCDKANNCVVYRDTLDIRDNHVSMAEQLRGWEFKVEFNKVEMLDVTRVNPLESKLVASFAVSIEGFVGLFKDFTGIDLKREYKSINSWRNYGRCNSVTNDWVLDGEKVERIKREYGESQERLYPDPVVTPSMKRNAEEALEAKKKRQLERIAKLERTAKEQLEAKQNADEQERQRKIDEQKRKEEERKRRRIEEERDFWKEYLPNDTKEWDGFFEKMMKLKATFGEESGVSLEQIAYDNMRKRMFNQSTCYYFIRDEKQKRDLFLRLAEEWYEKYKKRIKELKKIRDEEGVTSGIYLHEKLNFECQW